MHNIQVMKEAFFNTFYLLQFQCNKINDDCCSHVKQKSESQMMLTIKMEQHGLGYMC